MRPQDLSKVYVTLHPCKFLKDEDVRPEICLGSRQVCSLPLLSHAVHRIARYMLQHAVLTSHSQQYQTAEISVFKQLFAFTAPYHLLTRASASMQAAMEAR